MSTVCCFGVIINILQTRRLIYFRQVTRMEKDRYPNILMHGYTHGRRPKGKPRKRWLDNCTSASVPRGIVPTSRRCRIKATSLIRHPTAPGRTALPAQLLWPTGLILCGWSVGLEFPAGKLAESDYWREQFQTISEDVSVRNVLMHSAH